MEEVPPVPSQIAHGLLRVIHWLLLFPLIIAAPPTLGWDPSEAIFERWNWRVDSSIPSSLSSLHADETTALDVTSPMMEHDALRDSGIIPDTRVEPDHTVGNRVSVDFPPDIQKKLRIAYSLATRHIGEHEQCQALFTDLGADGLEMMAKTIYVPPPRDLEFRICGLSNLGFTRIGHRVTRICDRFATVSDEKSAIILIHEALHQAGLPEDSTSRHGFSSREINSMVKRACGFRPFM